MAHRRARDPAMMQIFSQPGKDKPKLKGLGDIVALVAEPVAKASDRLLKTKLVGCAPCAARRAKLNQKFPL
jgi:hypothetical protein